MEYAQASTIFLFLALVPYGSRAASLFQVDAKTVYRDAESSVFLIYINDSNGNPTAFGSGFLIGPRKIVTNAHVVVGGSPMISVGPVRIPAKIEIIDETDDLALLSVDVDLTSKPLRVSGAKPQTGENIFAIGNPEGLEKTISQGIISSIRLIDGRNLLQVTSPISHGSSGGPILDEKGEVAGVTVAMFKEGQNLNFAVPASTLALFLREDHNGADSNLNQTLASLSSELNSRKEPYSDDADSSYQKKTKNIKALMQKGLTSSDPNLLIDFARLAQSEDYDLSLELARKSQSLKSSPAAQLLIGQDLQILAIFKKGEDKQKDQEEATRSLESAVASVKSPTEEYFATLAYAREEQGKPSEAFAQYLKALNAPRDAWSNDREIDLRGLLRNSATLKLSSDRKKYFAQLVTAGKATAADWSSEAYRRGEDDSDFIGGAQAFEHAASLEEDGINWCRAVLYRMSGSSIDVDAVLKDGRVCLTREATHPTPNIQDLTSVLADVNVDLANVLNTRGVYGDALNYAREATKLEPDHYAGFDALGDSLYYLQRYTEAVSAEKEAIRLADGKYSYMHFRLGTAYFALEQWVAAEDSFERAWNQDPKNESAAFNVAASYANQGDHPNSAFWYKRVLKMNPNREDKDEILKKIESQSR